MLNVYVQKYNIFLNLDVDVHQTTTVNQPPKSINPRLKISVSHILVRR